jgi:hypothetical protein
MPWIEGVPFQESYDVQERAYLEFEPDPVRFRHIEKFDELHPMPLTFSTSSFEHVQSWIRSTLDRRLTTAPQISLPLSSSSPTRAIISHCQHWSSNAGLLFHREHPLASVRVRLILPHRLDPRLEQVAIRVAVELGRRLEPVEVPAIRLDRIELADSRQARFVGTGVGRRRVRASIRGGLWRERYFGLCVVIYGP